MESNDAEVEIDAEVAEVAEAAAGEGGEAASAAATEAAFTTTGWDRDAAAGDVRVVDLPGQERVVRGRMPALEAVNERFARQTCSALVELMQRDLRLDSAELRLARYGSFIDALPAPSNVNILGLSPLRGSALLVCEPDLIFMVIDALFGGTGKLATKLEGREFSTTEERVIQRLLGIACEAYHAAWDGIHPMSLTPQRREMQPSRAAIARTPDTVVLSRFCFALGERKASMHLCVPYAALEPIRDLLYAPAAADTANTDPRWMHELARQIQSAEVTLSAKLASTQATVERLLSLKAGDFIELDLAPLIQGTVEGVPIFEGPYGTSNGRYALKVERLLAGSNMAIARDSRRIE